MFVGEIGFSRREFLYEIKFWEARRILRGYLRRDRLKHQLIAECAYAAIYAMRDPKGKKVSDLFPSLFKEDEETTKSTPLSDEDRNELQELIRLANVNGGM